MGLSYNLCNCNKTDSTNEYNLTLKTKNNHLNKLSIEDGPIDKAKIAEYFIVDDDVVNHQGRETSSIYSLSKSKLGKNEASTLVSQSNYHNIQTTHFDLFINNHYSICTDWEETDITFLVKDLPKQTSEVLLIGELLFSLEEPINEIEDHQSCFCVLMTEELRLYLNKAEYNRRDREFGRISIEEMERVIMFDFKPGADRQLLHCIGLVVAKEGLSERTTLIYYFYSAIKTMICYWIKLLSFLMRNKIE